MLTLPLLLIEIPQQIFGERVLTSLPSIRKMTTLSKTHVKEMKSLPGNCKKKKIRCHYTVRNLRNAPTCLRQYAREPAVC